MFFAIARPFRARLRPVLARTGQSAKREASPVSAPPRRAAMKHCGGAKRYRFSRPKRDGVSRERFVAAGAWSGFTRPSRDLSGDCSQELEAAPSKNAEIGREIDSERA